MADPSIPAAYMAFTPATQKTTVVTTTTTTVSLPPFVFHSSAHRNKDPRQYPLAASNTPANLQRFSFALGGQTASFEEAPSADEALQYYRQQQAILSKADGEVVETYIDGEATHRRRKFQADPLGGAANGPPSLAKAAELAALKRATDKRQLSLKARSNDAGGFDQTQMESQFTRQHRLVPARQLPVTPGTDSGPQLGQDVFDGAETQAVDLVAHPMLKPHDTLALSKVEAGNTNSQESRQRDILSCPVATKGAQQQPGVNSTDQAPPANKRSSGRFSLPGSGLQDNDSMTAAPPVNTESGPSSTFVEPFPPRYRALRQQPSLLATSQQDASLPSPSLSPVTAARSRAARAAVDQAGDVHVLDRLDLPAAMKGHSTASSGDSCLQSAYPSPRTMMDVPEMIRTFDAMPEALQSYVSFQLLKCCSKRTLSALAGEVNQALKSDPLDVLPVEVSLQIARLLDAQTLCQAAQVSHRWRKFIDGNELIWKDLLAKEGYDVTEDEMQRAVREGWGWQGVGLNGQERDLRESSAALEDQPVGITSPSTSVATRLGLKRKATTHAAGNKRRKRRRASGNEESTTTWEMSPVNAQGRLGYATAAVRVMPEANYGLPGLRNMHFFKSIYMRNRYIRQSWVSPEATPKHLAFRAHNRHVVTCLLFDSQRIITGSDDSNIHVYDTQTGVLKGRLEGHEGGVWALACDGDTLVSGSTDRTVRVWNIATGRNVQTFTGHSSTVRCLVILKPTCIGTEVDGTPIVFPKEPIIITGSRDSTLRVWGLPDVNGPQEHARGDNHFAIRTLSGHQNSVRAIAAHGDTLVSGSYDETVRMWKVSTGETVHRLVGHAQKVYSVVLDHERDRCISGSMDRLVKVWDLKTGDCLFDLAGHTSLVGLLDLKDEFLVSAAADGTLRVWEPENGQCLHKLWGQTGPITCFQHDRQKVISGSDKTLKMWDIKSGKCVRDLLTDLSGVWQVKFDQRRCVAAVQRPSDNGTEENVTFIEVWDFGASRDGMPAENLGQRVVVDSTGDGTSVVEESARTRARRARMEAATNASIGTQTQTVVDGQQADAALTDTEAIVADEHDADAQ